MAEYPKQGEIWWASFYEGGERPALVVSRNELNRGRLILVVPCTSSQVEERAAYPNPDKPEPKKQKRTQRRRDAKLPQSFFLLLFFAQPLRLCVFA
jgi:mRNA-degrading endonuclease toxin of MazEF toxin-antitoxin module